MTDYKPLSAAEFSVEISLANKWDIHNNLILYKGIVSKNELYDYYYADPSNGIRASKSLKENGNIYNLLLNNLVGWRLFPKREKSIIVSSSLKTADSFGDVNKNNTMNFGKTYVVIPKMQSEIMIAPKHDIWYSFQKGLGHFAIRGYNSSLVRFNICLAEIFKTFKINEEYESNWEIFLSNIQQICINEIPKPNVLSFEAANVLNKLRMNSNHILQFIEKAFDPTENDFELKKYNVSLNKTDYPDNEIWTESACLLIEKKEFIDLVLQSDQNSD